MTWKRSAGTLGSPASSVARALGEPLQRVEGRVYRALRKLRDRLEP